MSKPITYYGYELSLATYVNTDQAEARVRVVVRDPVDDSLVDFPTLADAMTFAADNGPITCAGVTQELADFDLTDLVEDTKDSIARLRFLIRRARSIITRIEADRKVR